VVIASRNIGREIKAVCLYTAGQVQVVELEESTSANSASRPFTIPENEHFRALLACHHRLGYKLIDQGAHAECAARQLDMLFKPEILAKFADLRRHILDSAADTLMLALAIGAGTLTTLKREI